MMSEEVRMWPFKRKARIVCYTSSGEESLMRKLLESEEIHMAALKKVFREYYVPGTMAEILEKQREMNRMQERMARFEIVEAPPVDIRKQVEVDASTELGVMKNRLDELESKVAALTSLCRELWADRERKDEGGV